MGGLLDILTGGNNELAQDVLKQGMADVNAVQVPTSTDLQEGPLSQYYQTGALTPAMMQAAQAGPSAFDSENISGVPMSVMQQALAQESQIAAANGMTPQEQAQIAEAEQAVNANTAGQRGAIAQQFAGMGVPQSLISAALQNQTAGQTAQQGYMNALQAQGQAANQGLTALQNEGNLAGNMYGLQAGQQNTVAAAQNALNQFNAANSQQAGLANQANQQASNLYNTKTGQDIANQNIYGSNQRQYQNQVMAPQQAAQLALEKSGQQVGVTEAQAGQATAAGQQNAGLIGGAIGTIGNVIAAAKGGEIPDTIIPPTAFLRGGQVPGQPQVAGDSPANDTVPARLSPGEFVVPKTAMQRPEIRDFLAKNVPTPRPPSAHPSDVASLLKALSMLRAGA